MTDTAPIPIVFDDRTDTDQQPAITPAAQPWWEHVAIRSPRRRAHRQPIGLDTIARRATWAAAGLVIVLAAAGLHGPLAYIAVALLAAALAVRAFIAVQRDARRVNRLLGATRRR